MATELEVVRTSNKALVKSQPITAVFVGGTSGIGEYTMRALASTHSASGQGLRVYIVGRNESSANTIIDDCQKACPVGEFHFVRATDLSLIRDVDRTCNEIVKIEEARARTTGNPACIDLLVLTQAYFAFGGKLARQETSEGLDASMSLLYYSRMRFITQLLSLLLASPISGRVVSVFGPGRDTNLVLDDLSLRKPRNFGFGNLGSHAAYMTTFFFEKMAVNHPGCLALSHYFPKVVITPAYKGPGVPAWFKGIFAMTSPLFRAMSLTPDECGQRVLYHTSARFPARPTGMADPQTNAKNVEAAMSSDGVVGGGAYRTNWDGDIVPLGKGYKRFHNDEISQKVWEHTMKAFEIISAGDRFSG